MCQHLENIAIQISFEVYAARVALKCKFKITLFIILSKKVVEMPKSPCHIQW